MPAFANDLERGGCLRLLSALTDGKSIWDWNIPDDHFTCDPTFAANFGEKTNPDQAVLDWWLERIHPEERVPVRLSFEARLYNGGNNWSAEYRFRRVDGLYATVTDRAYIERDAKGAAQHITHALDLSPNPDELCKHLLEHTQQGVWMVEPAGITTYANAQMAQMLGCEPGALDGRSAFEFLFEEDLPDARRMFAELNPETFGKEMEFRYRRCDGSELWAGVKTSPILANGKLSGLIGTFSDFTQRRQTEELLRTSEQEFRTLFDSSAVGMGIVDSHTRRFLRVNPRFCEITGYTSEELRELTFSDITHPEDRARDWASYSKALQPDCSRFETEKRYVRKTGEIRWVHVNGTLVRDAEGKPFRTFAVIRDITPEKQAAEELAQVSERLELAIVAAELGPWEVDLINHVVHVSERTQRMFGFEELGVDFKEWLTRVHPQDRERIASLHQRLSTGLSEIETEYRTIPELGERWIYIRGKAVNDEKGRPVRVVGVAQDITQRKQAEEALRKSEQRYRQIIESTHEGVWLIDTDSVTTYVNPQMAAMLGYTPEEMCGRPSTDFLIEEAAERHETVAERIERLRKSERAEIRFRRRDGETCWAEVNISPLWDSAGELSGILQMYRDVSGRKRAEEEKDRIAAEHRRVREFLEKLIANTPIAIGATEGPEHRYVLANAALLAVAETLPVIGRPAAEIFPSLGDLPERDLSWASQKPVFLKEHFLPRNEGSEASYWNIGFVPLSDPEGSQRILCIAQNVTELVHARQQAQQAADESEHRAREAEEAKRILDAIMEYIPEGIVIAGPDGRTSVVSRRYAQNAGRPREVLENKRPEQLAEILGIRHLDGETLPSVDELPLLRALRKGEVIEDEEWILVDSEGRRRWFSANAGPLLDSENRIAGGIVSWRDISERKHIEERLRQAQRLDSIGMLAGGIAHDFNNLLVGVIGYTSLALQSLPPNDRIAEFLRQVMKSGEQAAHLTQQMLAYAGRGRFVIERVDLSHVVREVESLLQPLLSKKIELRLELQDDLPPIEGDPSQLHQVLMNLVANASEAIGDTDGLILVRTRGQEVTEQFVRDELSDADIPPGYYVCLEVRDTGCGMDAETCTKAFDPFFTTKFTGRGLGLAAVAGIMRSHKGAIRVYSEPGKGSSFLAAFPASLESSPETKPEEVKREDITGSGTLLVVDDEPVVRQLVQEALGQYGYEVLTASDGNSALQIFKRNPGRFSLVLLDLNMPGMNGQETFLEFQRINPNVKVLISSGYNESESLKLFEGQRIAGFIQKPYGIDDLARKVKAAKSGV